MLVTQSCPTLCDPVDCSPPGSSVHEIFPGKDTGGGCHFLLHGIFPTQGSNLRLLHCRQILYQLSYKGSPTKPQFKLKKERERHCSPEWWGMAEPPCMALTPGFCLTTGHIHARSWPWAAHLEPGTPLPSWRLLRFPPWGPHSRGGEIESQVGTRPPRHRQS